MVDPETRGSWQDLRAKLHAFVARRVGRQDVEDVLQDVILRIQRGLPRLRDGGRFGPWVYRIARNAVTDHLRGAKPDERLDPEAAHESSAEIVDEHERHELLGCVAPFVARLPAPYRQAITLTELEGQTQEQAAAMVGVSVSGMKSRVQRGRRQLRAMFEGCCLLDHDVRGRVIGCEPHASPDRSAAGCGADRGGCSPSRS
jgi:RNA polymerase sigma-70 factor (ECF subfamily)